jgi:hypothetical protein
MRRLYAEILATKTRAIEIKPEIKLADFQMLITKQRQALCSACLPSAINLRRQFWG